MILGISYMAFDGEELLEFAIKSIRQEVDFISIVYQNISYQGNLLDPKSLDTFNNLKSTGLVDRLEVYDTDLSLVHQANEVNARNLGAILSKNAGCTHHISADVDEFYQINQLKYAKNQMSGFDCSVVSLENYYKSPSYRIVPNQGHKVSFIHPVDNVYDRNASFPFKIDLTRRNVRSEKCRVFELSEFTVHHMSYVRKDIKKKLKNLPYGYYFDLNKFLTDFDKYQVGDRLLLPNDMNRRTMLADNIFSIPQEAYGGIISNGDGIG